MLAALRKLEDINQ